MCTGNYYQGWLEEEKPIRSYQFLTGGCFIVHLILSIPITLVKRKMDKKETQLPQNQCYSPSMNFGGLKTGTIHIILR